MKKRKYLAYGLAAWAIWFSGIFGNRGLKQAYELTRAKKELELRVTALQNEYSRLEESLHDLESDAVTQEAAAREVLGMAREGELVFEFIR